MVALWAFRARCHWAHTAIMRSGCTQCRLARVSGNHLSPSTSQCGTMAIGATTNCCGPPGGGPSEQSICRCCRQVNVLPIPQSSHKKPPPWDCWVCRIQATARHWCGTMEGWNRSPGGGGGASVRAVSRMPAPAPDPGSPHGGAPSKARPEDDSPSQPSCRSTCSSQLGRWTWWAASVRNSRSHSLINPSLSSLQDRQAFSSRAQK
mmetsp:Transcript_147231/g.257197  ORF Transcript_147231/g.257197 Transcript_147231/m.257197 type:complete len:206 (-) Transcript_147231:1595-2212(-)